jgi:hypothetical protein
VLQTSVVSPSGFFRIHYDETGSNIPSFSSGLSVEQNVAEVAKSLDSTYKFEVDFLGFLSPPSDNGAGGDNKYDVYIQNQGGGVYGYTEWENKIGQINWTSFMVIDNDYIGYYSTGLNGMKVTVAHEFHHGIQVGNYAVENGSSPYRQADLFLYELTSTSMEEFVYDNVNDYYAYMLSYFQNPEKAFPNQNGYNLAIWNLYMQERFDFGILKEQWELIPSISAILAINNTIQVRGSSFPGELNKFGIWTYYTNSRSIPGSYFEEATNYPLVSPTSELNYTPPQQTVEGNSQPTANNFVLFDVSSNDDSLFAIITNGDASQSPNQSFAYDYTLYNNPTSGQRELTANYSSTFSATNSNFWSVSEILNDLLVRSDSVIVPIVEVNESLVFPNPFVYSSNYTSSFINIALNMENGATVDFNVYSPDLELVYSTTTNVGPLRNNSIGIYWDAFNEEGEKLASGVYIYVIKNGEEVVKGKVVIFNE